MSMAPTPSARRLSRRSIIGAVTIAVGAAVFAAAFMPSVWRSLPATTTAPAASAPSAQIETPDSVDIGYSQTMAAHHDQAVVMARLVSGRVSAPVQMLVESILASQMIEIGQLRGWLMLWGRPLLPTDSQMRWIDPATPDEKLRYAKYLAMCRANGGAMPGAASGDELNRLASVSGDEADALFLQLMIRHHRSALVMSQYASDNAKVAAVRLAAKRSLIEQTTEINQMTMILKPYKIRK